MTARPRIISRRIMAGGTTLVVVALSSPVLAGSTVDAGTAAGLPLVVRQGQVFARVPFGNGIVEVKIPLDPAEVSGTRLRATVGDLPRHGTPTLRLVPKASATQAAAGAAGSDDLAAQYPAVRSPRPGTIVTMAGGYCDGELAASTTISPRRLITDPRGKLFWVDDDSSYLTGADQQAGVAAATGTSAGLPYFVRHLRGSSLIRTVDAAGRVRTLGPVIGPEEGWRGRTDVDRGQLQQVAVTPAGRVFVNVNAVYSPIDLGRPIPGAPMSAAVQELLPTGEHRLVVGGAQYRPELDRDDSTYGENDPVTKTALASVQAIAADTLGNLFVADSSFIRQPRPGSIRIRYANLGRKPVTFYGGTAEAVTIAPGRIRTVAGHRNTNPSDLAGYGKDNVPASNGPARQALFALVPTMVVRNGILYVQDDRGVAGLTQGRVANVQIKAVNLGLTGSLPRVLNGVSVANGTVATLVGQEAGTGNSSPDPGLAQAAQFGADIFNFLGGFDVNRAGDIAIADPFGSRVRVVDALGIITTVAGVGLDGDGPVGQAAVTASLHRPESVAYDPAGRLLIADYFNARIRLVDADGRLQTTVGRGPTACGDGLAATGRTVYGGAYFGALRAVTANGRGETFVADASFEQVRRISATGQVDAVVGLPTPCVGTDEFDLATCPLLGLMSVQPDSPQAAAAVQLINPIFLAPDSYGNLYISDIDRIRYVNFGTRAVSVHGITVPPHSVVTLRSYTGRAVRITGNRGGQYADIPFDHTVPIPVGDITTDGKGNLFIADPPTGHVYRLDQCGTYTSVAGTGKPAYPDGGGPTPRDDSTSRAAYGEGKLATDANIIPRGLAYDRRRDVLLVLDPGWPGDCACGYGGERIRAINFGTKRTTMVGVPIAPGHIEGIAGLRSGGVFGDGGLARDASFDTFSTLAVAPDGRIYLGEAWHNTVRVVLPDGRIGTIAGPWPGAGPGLPWPSRSPESYTGDGGPALEAQFTLGARQSSWNKLVSGQAFVGMAPNGGDLLIADMTGGRVRKVIDPSHAPIRFGDGGSSKLARLPRDVVFGQFGADNTLLEPTGQVRHLRGIRVAEGRAGELYVTAANDTGEGCAIWRLKRRPDLSFDTTAVGEPYSKLPTGQVVAGGACRIAVRTSGGSTTLVTATPVQASEVACNPGGVNSTCDPRIVAMATSTSTDFGKTWQQSYVPTTDAAPADAGGMPELFTYGSGFRLMYLDASHAVHLLGSPDGIAWTSTAVLPGNTLELGRPTVRGGTIVVPTLARATAATSAVGVLSSFDGVTWTSSTAGTVEAAVTSGLTAPDAAIAPDGAVLLTWSDNRSVFASYRAASSWTAPLRLPGTQVSVLPAIAVADNGTIGVAYATTTSGATSADSESAAWYAVAARIVRQGSRLTLVDRAQVSSSPIAVGPMCFAKECPLRINSRDLVLAARAEGHALTVLRISRPQTTTARVTVATSCAGFLSPGRQAGCVGRAAPPPAPVGAAPPEVTDGLPTVVEPGLAGCSPKPPPEPARPVSAPQPVPGIEPQPNPQPGVAVIPPVVAPPAPIPGSAVDTAVGPASSSQVNSANQQVQQTQSSHQLGAAPGMSEEEEQQTAEEYAFSRIESPVGLGLGGLAVLAMAAAVEVQRRSRTSPAGAQARRSRRSH
jgi:hypothetical protein